MTQQSYSNGAARAKSYQRQPQTIRLLDITEMDGFGTIKWYDGDKRYGFITPDLGGRDIFLHASVVRLYGLRDTDMAKGIRVGYSIDEPKPGRGPEAKAVAIA